MKIIYTYALLVFYMLAHGFSVSHAQEKQLNIGLGLGKNGIPVYLGADFHLVDDVTWGLQANYRFNQDNGVLGGGGNVNYHFDRIFKLPTEWNVYAGVNVGFFLTVNGQHNDGLGLGAQVGGRYWLNKRWALNLELGGGNIVNEGKIGATVKL